MSSVMMKKSGKNSVFIRVVHLFCGKTAANVSQFLESVKHSWPRVLPGCPQNERQWGGVLAERNALPQERVAVSKQGLCAKWSVVDVCVFPLSWKNKASLVHYRKSSWPASGSPRQTWSWAQWKSEWSERFRIWKSTWGWPWRLCRRAKSWGTAWITERLLLVLKLTQTHVDWWRSDIGRASSVSQNLTPSPFRRFWIFSFHFLTFFFNLSPSYLY